MKKHIKRFAESLILLTILLISASCDKNDDIDAIFREPTWYLTFVQDGEEKFIPKEGQFYSVEFRNDKFTVNMPNGSTLKGEWFADGGGSHTFYCRNVKKEGEIWRDDIALKMYDIFVNSDSYEGDTNWLQIRTKDTNRYMQFYNK